MKAWGFSKEDLWRAARMASRRIGPGTALELRNVTEHGVTVKTVSFILRFESSTKRLLKRERIKLDPSNEAEYPPGVMVRPHYWYALVLDPIPASELIEDGPKLRKELRRSRRSCGAPCWHTFGHFLRCAFEINPEGRIKPGLADYRGAE